MKAEAYTFTALTLDGREVTGYIVKDCKGKTYLTNDYFKLFLDLQSMPAFVEVREDSVNLINLF